MHPVENISGKFECYKSAFSVIKLRDLGAIIWVNRNNGTRVPCINCGEKCLADRVHINVGYRSDL